MDWSSDGVLTESCDAPDRQCDDNGKQFKGIFQRYWMDLADTTHDARYVAFVQQQATSVWDHDRDAAGRLGERWSGLTNADHPNAFDWRTQASALSALIAAVPKQTPPMQSLSATLSPAQPVVMPASGSADPRQAQGRSAGHCAGWCDQGRGEGGGARGVGRDAGRATTTLRPHGNAVPARVECPAGRDDSRWYARRALPGDRDGDVRSPLAFSAQADILVAHTVDFDTGTAAETPWLWDADGSQSNGIQNRFADGNAYFVYRFPFPADTAAAHAMLTIDNEYVVQVSGDGQNWTTVLTETQHAPRRREQGGLRRST